MSMAMDGLNAYMDPSIFRNASMTGGTSGTNLSGKLEGVGASASADELKEVCREFESYFMEQVYKEMFKTIGSEDGDSSMSSLVGYFKDEVIQKVAAQTTEQNGGPLAQKLYEQMKRNYGIIEADEA